MVKLIDKDCLNCRWVSYNGSHLGCYFDNRWRAWLPQKDAKILACCEAGDKYAGSGLIYQLEECRWQPND